jgi:uncharacterized protein
LNVSSCAISFSPLGEFAASGDLRARLQNNFTRLEEEKYQPDHVFQREKEASNWPGDTEGRTILALVLLARASGRTPRYLDAIIDRWPREVNERGYFGTIQPGNLISEQQLSGHGWALRALSELERWRPRGPARALAQPIIENLILPTAGQHRTYPLDPAARQAEGSFSGTHLGRVGNWLLSTDVGCDFICLDGVVDAYDVFRDARLKPIVAEMAARFLELDLIAVKAQTHATLTACRALLRWSEIVHDESLVAAVAQRFELYTTQAWTEHYANFNWFGRPQWTEPCAIVDSLMVAMELWRRTQRTAYLEQAHHIYFNALGHAQRANGGFGCDNCPGADGEDDLFFRVYEAHWCCTMRGGEGLSRFCQYNLARRDDTLVLPFGLAGEVQGNDWSLKIASGYPHEAKWVITLRANAASGIKAVEVFVPSWIQKAQAVDLQSQPQEFLTNSPWIRLMLMGTKSEWIVTGSLAEGVRPLVNPAAGKAPRVVRFRGPLVLANRPDGSGVAPIFGAYTEGIGEIGASRRRLLIPEIPLATGSA